MKIIYEFYKKVAFFRRFRWLPIEGINIFVRLAKKFPTHKWEEILLKVQKLAILAAYHLRGYFIAGQI